MAYTLTPRFLAAATIFLYSFQQWHALAQDFWPNTPERTALREELLWDWGRTYSGVHIDGQPLTSVLSSVLSTYRFMLPVVQLERGLTYRGSSSRLRHVVGRLLTGHPVHVGLIGGSISWGHGSTKRGEKDWFSHFSNWLMNAFPRSNITARNGCVPGVPAAYMIMCLERSLDHADVELVFVEFTLNDGTDSMIASPQAKNMERLVRRLLALPRRPAVVLLQTPTHGLANYPPGHPRHMHEYRRFYETMEDVEGAIAQYYDVQTLSVRTALYRLAVFKETDGFQWQQTFWDIHPGDAGHRVMADLAVFLIQQTAIGMLLRPYGPADEEAVADPLPEPMHEGNRPPDAPMCILYDDFRSLVIEAQGFEYVNEGTPEKPKQGFVATAPGARLVMRINTDRGGAGLPPDTRVPVWVQHLKSYEHMGVAAISCISGCSCETVKEDALMDRHASQLYMLRLDVTQAAECDVEVKVLPETQSGEHKFKVAGVVIAESEGRNYLETMYGNKGGEFGMAEHNGGRTQMVRTRDGLKGDVRRLLRAVRGAWKLW